MPSKIKSGRTFQLLTAPGTEGTGRQFEALFMSAKKNSEERPVVCPSLALTLWLFNSHGIDGPFIDGLPIKNGDFPWLC